MSRLDDYLDDRMDAAERARFEEELARDEELARKVEASLAVREALRGGDDELSPGFYTRTVARFSARRRRAPLGLTWSTVGLAAAALAAAAIFLPPLLREELPLDAEPAREREETGSSPVGTDPRGNRGLDPAQPAEAELGAPLRQVQAGAVDGSESLAPGKGDQPSQEPVEAKQKIAAGRVREDLQRQAPATPPTTVTQRSEGRAADKINEQAFEETVQVRSARISESQPVAPLPDAEPRHDLADSLERSQSEANVVASLKKEQQAAGRGALDVSSDDAGSDELAKNLDSAIADNRGLDRDAVRELEADLGLSTGVQALAAIELPRDLVGAGEIEARFGARRAPGSKASADAPAAPQTRFVVIGPRPGLDRCESLAVRRTEHAWEITFTDSGSGVGAVSCGLPLPDDGRPVRFQGGSDDE